ncbi:helix-turn-helix transcriptional regulator [Fructobacillus sp. CRL 2054]|uniref:helix-turn-helix domain-containing protein n=1 Tax=Fructobacillus sp. CRL 2054 TaxID=2763007 RepID=UPI0023780162|nr:helix-turn-helix transcriptional regulator [Fructobacillus sp. CRL 2054]MDD9138350.1 helix-turn-helix transcriptional regulator [Fructobacillus sp. CRL 2054]
MKRLAELRKEKGVSQIELAEQISFSHSVISRYETGGLEPNISNLKKMATYFNVSIDYLVGYSDER